MKKIILSALSLVVFSFSLHSAEQQYFVIEKVNKGTLFLKPGQEFAGFLTNNSVCGASGEGLGAGACAVVSPTSEDHGQPLYYLEEVYVTGTPASNLVGFIQGSIKHGMGIGGNKGTGVFKKE